MYRYRHPADPPPPPFRLLPAVLATLAMLAAALLANR